MRLLKFLLEKEFKQVLRNPIILPLIILLPTIQLAILPHAATYEIRNINIEVVDHDRSSYSNQLSKKIASSGYFKIKDISSSYKQALYNLENGLTSIIVEIPNDFEKDIRDGNGSNVFISADAVDGTKGSIGSSYLTQIIMDFSMEKLESLILSNPNIKEDNKTAQIEIIPLYRYNPDLNYKTYMVPGIIVMILTLVGGILAALNIVNEKEQGTLEQINVSPIPKQYYLLSKLIPFWIVGLIILSVSLLVAYFLFGIVIKGNIFILFLFAAVYLFAFTGFGLLISTAASTQQQSMFIAFFFLLIFFLMGGLFTPISSMPKWAQIITYFNPTAYLIDVFRAIILKGSGFFDLIKQFFILCGFAVFFNLWAILSYRKTS